MNSTVSAEAVNDVYVAIIGGGPAGLMAANTLLNHGVAVKLFDAMPSLGRKFLMAGKSGLNLTHAEPLDTFLTRYGLQQNTLSPLIKQFGPKQIQAWANKLGIETFIGSSGRVFPTEMKAAPLLRAWLHELRAKGLETHTRHTWSDWQADGTLVFQTPVDQLSFKPTATLLALGGASWPKLGSTGHWQKYFFERDIPLSPFKPANCGFNIPWSDYIKTQYAGSAIKSVTLSVDTLAEQQYSKKGDFVISHYGIEGSLVYGFTSLVREAIAKQGVAKLYLDLCPDHSAESLIKSLSRPRGSNSLAKHLQRCCGIKGIKAKLLWEFIPSINTASPKTLAKHIKQLILRIESIRPIEEAISSAGGVKFEALDDSLMLQKEPGVFCAGEMLDWEAPTGGYLFTACFATGHAAALGMIKWLNDQPSSMEHS